MTEQSLNERLHEIDRRLSVHEVVHRQDITSMENARALQAKEYERRLDILNGEASRLREMQATYVPREVYEQRHQEVVAWINELKGYRDTSIGRQAIIATIIPVIVSLLFLWLNKR